VYFIGRSDTTINKIYSKKTWMKKNKNGLSKWNIKMHEFPNIKEEIKKFMNENFSTAIWTNRSESKKTYYIKDFNANFGHSENTYLGETIKGKEKTYYIKDFNANFGHSENTYLGETIKRKES
jgi:hypothetical protein